MKTFLQILLPCLLCGALAEPGAIAAETPEAPEGQEASRGLVSRQVFTYSMREPGLFAQRLAGIKAAIDDSRCTRHLEIVMSTFQTGEICPFSPPGEVFRFRRVGSPPSEEAGYPAPTAESAAAGPGGLTDIFGCHEITAQVFVSCECTNTCEDQLEWICNCPDTEPGKLPPGIESGTGFPATVTKEAFGILCGNPGPCELPFCTCLDVPGQPNCAECIDPCTGQVAFSCPIQPQ